MRTLIFGGTGMLGCALVAEGRRRGYPALGLSRHQADICNRAAVDYWVEAFRPDLIVNSAAFTRVDDCETRRDHALEVNGRAVGNVAAAAATAGARLVQPSTDYVFDGSSTTPYREDATTGPISAYGESKLLGEQQALAYERALVVRVSWLFGPGGPNFVATMIRLMREGRRELRVVDDQVGGPTYTPFLAQAIYDLAASDQRGVLHYQNREPVSWCGFAREIARLWDPEVQVVPLTTAEYPLPARRPAYSVLDVSRCEQALGRRVEAWSLGLADLLNRQFLSPVARRGAAT